MEKLVNKKIKGITLYGEEYEAIVVAVDFEKGITIDALEPELLAKMGFDMSKDNHMYCLNIEQNSSSDYEKEFKTTVKMIQEGTYDVRKIEKRFYKEGWGPIASCAFD
jgi:hypothetical protein